MNNMINENSQTPLELAEENLIIQKSMPLLSLWRSPLTLPEFKILDMYLSRIDSRHPEQRWVRFEKGELENLLGVSRIMIGDLKKRLRNLCITVELPVPNSPNSLDAISLFERAVCTPDENGIWQIDLQCTLSAMKYIFNIENIGYLRYKLRSICHITSRYSYILFLYLERNRFRGSWEEDVSSLREMLGCESEYYNSFKKFNQKILQRCQKELIEKTECGFIYEPIRRGRYIRSIRFSIDPIPVEEFSGSLPRASNTETTALPTDYSEFMRSACIDPRTGKPEFSRAEIAQILEIMRTIPFYKLPAWTPGGDYKFALYHYLAERYAAMNRYSEKKVIANRINYLISTIAKDTTP